MLGLAIVSLDPRNVCWVTANAQISSTIKQFINKMFVELRRQQLCLNILGLWVLVYVTYC